MKTKKTYELSHTIIPEFEEYHIEVDSRQVEEWDQFKKYHRIPDQHYLISEVSFCTHVGTHIELPFHHDKGGLDAAEFPLERLIGETLILDISRFGNNQEITYSDLVEISDGRVKKDDILFFYSGLDQNYYTNRQHERPFFSNETIRWLVDEVGIKMMGVDTSGHEVRNQDGTPIIGQPNHELLLGSGIPLIEYLTNLEPIINKRIFTITLPVKIKAIEAFPVRVIGIEWENS